MDVRKEWIEPEVKQLEVSETAYNPGTGGDPQVGNASYPDCSRS